MLKQQASARSGTKYRKGFNQVGASSTFDVAHPFDSRLFESILSHSPTCFDKAGLLAC